MNEAPAENHGKLLVKQPRQPGLLRRCHITAVEKGNNQKSEGLAQGGACPEWETRSWEHQLMLTAALPPAPQRNDLVPIKQMFKREDKPQLLPTPGGSCYPIHPSPLGLHPSGLGRFPMGPFVVEHGGTERNPELPRAHLPHEQSAASFRTTAGILGGWARGTVQPELLQKSKLLSFVFSNCATRRQRGPQGNGELRHAGNREQL